MKKGLVLLLMIGIISCTSNTIYKKPEDLISKDSMVILLTDLYLASSSKIYRNKFDERNIDYTYLIYEKYKIDSARFRRSNFYYTTKIDDYEKIYKGIEQNLEVLSKKYKGIKKVKDSIRKDSITKVRKIRDSIKKLEKQKKLDTLSVKKTDSINSDNIALSDTIANKEILFEKNKTSKDTIAIPKK